MVVAKTLQAQTNLVDQLQKRSVSRIYECIVVGVVTAGGKIDAPIGRHGGMRQRMAVTDGGKPAVSHYRVLKRFRSHTHVRVKLEPAVPTRSACTWPMWASRWSATRPTAGASAFHRQPA